jgi:hypothetical protein
MNKNNVRETSIKDPNGKILISPGLKVRHKDSGFEYTVDSIVKQNGEMFILLNLPDEPRLEPTKTRKRVIDREINSRSNVIYEYELDRESYFYVPEDLEQTLPDKLAVSVKEFEKNYEVN